MDEEIVQLVERIDKVSSAVEKLSKDVSSIRSDMNGHVSRGHYRTTDSLEHRIALLERAMRAFGDAISQSQRIIGG